MWERILDGVKLLASAGRSWSCCVELNLQAFWARSNLLLVPLQCFQRTHVQRKHPFSTRVAVWQLDSPLRRSDQVFSWSSCGLHSVRWIRASFWILFRSLGSSAFEAHGVFICFPCQLFDVGPKWMPTMVHQWHKDVKRPRLTSCHVLFQKCTEDKTSLCFSSNTFKLQQC